MAVSAAEGRAGTLARWKFGPSERAMEITHAFYSTAVHCSLEITRNSLYFSSSPIGSVMVAVLCFRALVTSRIPCGCLVI